METNTTIWFLLALWAILSLIVGILGHRRHTGFAKAFVVSLLGTPVLGFIYVLTSQRDNPINTATFDDTEPGDPLIPKDSGHSGMLADASPNKANMATMDDVSPTSHQVKLAEFAISVAKRELMGDPRGFTEEDQAEAARVLADHLHAVDCGRQSTSALHKIVMSLWDVGVEGDIAKASIFLVHTQKNASQLGDKVPPRGTPEWHTWLCETAAKSLADWAESLSVKDAKQSGLTHRLHLARKAESAPTASDGRIGDASVTTEDPPRDLALEELLKDLFSEVRPANDHPLLGVWRRICGFGGAPVRTDLRFEPDGTYQVITHYPQEGEPRIVTESGKYDITDDEVLFRDRSREPDNPNDDFEWTLLQGWTTPTLAAFVRHYRTDGNHLLFRARCLSPGGQREMWFRVSDNP